MSRAFQAPSRQEVTPGDQGAFPGFDVLAQVGHWDQVTAGVVLARLNPPPDYSFFTPDEQATAGALFDQLLGQRHEPKVPVLLLVDRRLALDETDGWRYEGMPEDGDAWRITLAGLDDDARSTHHAPFHALHGREQAALIQAVQEADGNWHGLAATNVWSLWTRYACAAFYSHPWAWNEIGFSGPAYPRGYKSRGRNGLESWEVTQLSRPGG